MSKTRTRCDLYELLIHAVDPPGWHLGVMATGMLAPKPCPSSGARMPSPTPSCCSWWSQVTNTLTEVTVRLLWCICYSYVLLFLDGIQDGDTLSPTDIEANMSTEVALTVLDVLELFVQHQKVCDHFILYNPKVKLIPQSITLYFFREIYFLSHLCGNVAVKKTL